ncbi:MAG: hypothetical protein QXI12_00445 [Candidatus Methanomethyliaceae archaeon]
MLGMCLGMLRIAMRSGSQEDRNVEPVASSSNGACCNQGGIMPMPAKSNNKPNWCELAREGRA